MTVATPACKPATRNRQRRYGFMLYLRTHRWTWFAGGFLGILLIAILLFRWDWLIPIVDRQASAALGRPVHVQHLHVSLGRTTRVELEGITVENPANWPGGGNFATIERLGVDLDAMAYIRGREIVLPVIDVQAPRVDAQQLADGNANWRLGSADQTPSTGPGPKLGTLRIADGQVHVRSAPLNADFNVNLATQNSSDGQGKIVADAKGTYAKQPITAQFTGGALLSLRDAATPYPVDLQVANGPTKVSLVGTVQNPLDFAGVDLTLALSGPDMALLLPLTGIAIPKTPAYTVKGKLDYADGRVKFENFAGKVGSSDLAGNIDVDTKPKRPVLVADLQSKRVDLKDLGGFIGADPGDADKGTKKPARNNGQVLPDDPISLPKLTVADVHLKYRAARIEGRKQPLDNMRADLDIVNGDVHLHPLAFGIGGGQITSNIVLAQKNDQLHAKLKSDFQRVDIGKLLASTGVARGAGTLGGQVLIEGTGKSVADILGDGNGQAKLFVGHGGNVSALLVDLSGLQFGNALLSALGIPDRAILQCFAADVTLQKGRAAVRTMILDTDEARVNIVGGANMKSEALGLTLETEAKHFSIGTLQTPIDIKGTFGSPKIAPQIGPLALRGGAAVALGIIGTPLAALLPTIEFGTGEDGACKGLLQSARKPPVVPAPTSRPARNRR